MAAVQDIKPLPCSEEELREVASQYRTPFYLYDKEKIVNGAKFFYDSFAWVHSLTGTQFKNHFAIKATPNPMILKILREECGMAMDCCSLGELMLCNLNVEDLAQIARMMFTLAVEIKNETGISAEFVDMGGGIGVNYHPDDKPIDLRDLGLRVKSLYEEIVLPHKDLHPLQIKYECGSVVTAQNGWLVSRVVNMKDTYKRFLGVDASMTDFSVSGPYGVYNAVTIVKDQLLSNEVRKNLPDYKTIIDDPSYFCPNHQGDKRERMFDVVGSVCTKCDKFAVDRMLNVNPEIGDLCIIHSAGAYGYAMSCNFNGKLQPAEILRVGCNHFEMIRRAQTYNDYFATMLFP